MEVKSENANNSCSNEGQKTLSFPIIPPVVLSHIASNKLDGFKYAADDMMLKNRKLFSFSDDFSISYHVESPTRNVKKFISDGMTGKTFKWDLKTLSLMIGTEYSLAQRRMLGKDGKILPRYKKQILAAIGYYHLKLQLQKVAGQTKGKLFIPDNPFIILSYVVKFKDGNNVFEKMHVITMFHNL